MRPDAIVATGRSDYPNQVNNVLGFPFIFRGALDVRATAINEAIGERELSALAAESLVAEIRAGNEGLENAAKDIETQAAVMETQSGVQTILMAGGAATLATAASAARNSARAELGLMVSVDLCQSCMK